MTDSFIFNEVNSDNVESLSPIIVSIIEKSSFVSVDAEFSGIHGPGTGNKDVAERYSALSEVVRSYAVLSLGLSAFVHVPSKDGNEYSLRVHNFHILLSCEPHYQVHSASLSFLAKNGFDFNRCYLVGVPYWPGSPKDPALNCDEVCGRSKRFSRRRDFERAQRQNTSLRSVICALLNSSTPVVAHNGLLDLMFIYHHFYSSLPPSLTKFVNDCASLFKRGGVYDTKHIAETAGFEGPSFLASLFRNCERRNESRRVAGSGTHLSFHIYPELDGPDVDDTKSRKRKLSLELDGGSQPLAYAPPAKKACSPECVCEESHDGEQPRLDSIKHGASIGHTEEESGLADRSLTLTSEKATDPKLEARGQVSGKSEMPSYYHSAVFDSYITGYVFCFQLLQKGCFAAGEKLKISENALQLARNCIYLPDKSLPLKIFESKYPE